MTDEFKVTVVILNWNGESLLRRFLPSIVRHLPDIAQLVVADNGSTDGSLQYVRSEFPSVRIKSFDTNLGFAEGYNRALADIVTPYAILLNSDVEAKDDWITPLVNFMDAHPDVGACQPKILSATNPDSFEYAGAAGGFLDRHAFPYCRGRIFNTVEKDHGQYDTPMEVFWASGAALLVRTEEYYVAGALDPLFFAHMEEIDLCWRLQLWGFKVAVVPKAAVYHLGGGSLPVNNPKKTFLNFRNNLLMLYKNLPWEDRTKYLRQRRLLDTIAWIKFVLTFNFANAAAVFQAHRSFADMRREYPLPPQKNLLRRDRHSRLSIIWQYFVRRRKNYSDLTPL